MHELFIHRALPLVRHDYRAFESYLKESSELTLLPLRVVWPRDDPVVSAAQCRDWLTYSSAPAVMYETKCPGHFFLTEHTGRGELVTLLLGLLGEMQV